MATHSSLEYGMLGLALDTTYPDLPPSKFFLETLDYEISHRIEPLRAFPKP